MLNVTTLLLPVLMAGQGGNAAVLRPNIALSARCGPTADKTRGPRLNRSMKLGDQPPAAQVLTVYRRDADGCPAPVVLREGIGANPDKALPMARGHAMTPAR